MGIAVSLECVADQVVSKVFSHGAVEPLYVLLQTVTIVEIERRPKLGSDRLHPFPVRDEGKQRVSGVGFLCHLSVLVNV